MAHAKIKSKTKLPRPDNVKPKRIKAKGDKRPKAKRKAKPKTKRAGMK